MHLQHATRKKPPSRLPVHPPAPHTNGFPIGSAALLLGIKTYAQPIENRGQFRPLKGKVPTKKEAKNKTAGKLPLPGGLFKKS
jgi:hypothetical protein